MSAENEPKGINHRNRDLEFGDRDGDERWVQHLTVGELREVIQEEVSKVMSAKFSFKLSIADIKRTS